VKKRFEPLPNLFFAMPQMPQPLMRGDQAFKSPPAVLFGWNATAGQHRFECLEQLLSHHKVLRVAGMMERHQNLVRQPAALTWTARAAPVSAILANPVLFSKLAHARPAGRPGKSSNPLDILSLALLRI
jgi:hypothetical protein